MNKNMKIFICTLLIFIFLGAGLFKYFKVIESNDKVGKYYDKKIDWYEFMEIEPIKKITLYNFTSKNYDDYSLEEINYKDIKTTTKDIIKEVNKRSKDRSASEDIPKELKYDQNTFLILSNIIIEPIYISEKIWHDKLESQTKVYNNISTADLYNIPKEITDKNMTWYLLTDKVKFENNYNKFNCTASYSRVERVEEEMNIVDEYNIKAIYSGKQITKYGNVYLRYKLIPKQVIISKFSFKILLFSILTLIFLLSAVYLYSRKKRNEHSK